MTLERQVHELEVRVKKLEQFIKALIEEREQEERLAIIRDEAIRDIELN